MQHDRVVGVAGDRLPDFLGGKAEDRRQQFDQRLRDVPQRVLCRAAGSGACGAGVQTVLEDIEVEAAEVFRAKSLQRLHDAVEFVFPVIGFALRLQLARHGPRVAVDFQPLLDGQSIHHRIKVRGIGQQKTQGVADAAIGLDDTLQDFVGNRQLARVVGGGRPQAQDVGAERIGDLLRRDDVAHRLGHLAAFAVHYETVREQRVIGCAAVDGAGGQERTLEPAAVLVGAFEVEIGRETALFGVRATHHGEMRDARIEPHVKRVVHLAIVRGLVAEQFARVEREPRFDTGFFDAQGDLLDEFRRARMQRPRFLMQEEGDRYAPVALARDAPVGTGLDHRFQSGAAPGREKLGFVDGTLGDPAQAGAAFVRLVIHAAVICRAVIHADEPLRRGAEDDRRLVPPAVRVAVADLLQLEQATQCLQFLQDERVGLPDRLAGQRADRQRRGVAQEATVVTDRVVDRQAVNLADLVVLGTVCRCGVDETRPRFDGDVRAADDRHVARLEGVAQRDMFKRLAFGRADDLTFQVVALQAVLGQFVDQDQRALRRLDEVVVEIRMGAHRLVGRQGPGRGRPDHGEGRSVEVR